MSEAQDAIIDATMTLLADRPFEDVTLIAIADASGVGLAGLQAQFPTRGHIISAFARRIDQAVLSSDYSDMADEPARERLFDVLMSRIEALRPYREAMAALLEAARRDPLVGMALNALAVRSAAWDLAAAGLQATGWRGRLATQDLAISFSKVLQTFVQESDPGMPRTLAALDKALKAGENRHGRFARFFGKAVSNERAPTQASSAADAFTPDAPDEMPSESAEPVAEPEEAATLETAAAETVDDTETPSDAEPADTVKGEPANDDEALPPA